MPCLFPGAAANWRRHTTEMTSLSDPEATGLRSRVCRAWLPLEGPGEGPSCLIQLLARGVTLISDLRSAGLPLTPSPSPHLPGGTGDVEGVGGCGPGGLCSGGNV